MLNLSIFAYASFSWLAFSPEGYANYLQIGGLLFTIMSVLDHYHESFLALALGSSALLVLMVQFKKNHTLSFLWVLFIAFFMLTTGLSALFFRDIPFLIYSLPMILHLVAIVLGDPKEKIAAL